MDIKERKQKIVDGFQGLANGDSEPLMSLFDSGVSWKIIGTTKFSGTYDGIEDLTERLLVPIHEALDGSIKLTADNLIGEGNYIVCQGRGKSKLNKGGNYNNIYCWVYRWSGDKIVEVTEYLDTEAVDIAFD
ncbi:MAG: nuclear transport factor 2 family protein [Pseudomonadota bacterium]|nr:nuclear transport factor 2 family protein [Pseudomonadota bacterium]